MCAPANATDWVLGGGLGFDEQDGRALSGLVDVGVTDSTWVGLSLGRTEVDSFGDTIESRSANLSVTQRFGNFGVRASAGVWGDPDALESTDLGLGVFYSGPSWYFGVDAERRDLELTFTFLPDNPNVGPVNREANATADGIGARIRYQTENRTRFTLAGRTYDYDRDLNRLTALEFIRRLTPTTLLLSDSLRDSSVSLSLEQEFGEHIVGLELSRDELGVGEVDIDGVALNWLLPAGQRSDLEFIVGVSDSDDTESAWYLQAFYYFYLSN